MKGAVDTVLIPVLARLNKLGNQEFVLYNYEGAKLTKLGNAFYILYY